MFQRVIIVFLLVSALDVGASVKTDSGGEPRGRGTTPFFPSNCASESLCSGSQDGSATVSSRKTRRRTGPDTGFVIRGSLPGVCCAVCRKVPCAKEIAPLANRFLRLALSVGLLSPLCRSSRVNASRDFCYRFRGRGGGGGDGGFCVVECHVWI